MDASTSLLVDQESSRNRPGLFRRLVIYFKSETADDDTEPVPFFQLFRFATKGQIATYIVACTLSLMTGLLTPAYLYVASRLTEIYVNEKLPTGNEEFLWKVWKLASFFFLAFLLVITLEYIQYFMLTWTSEQIVKKCRCAFVSAILARDPLHFTASTGELSSQLSSHVDRMREGMGDKIGLFLKSLATFVSCCTFSFVLDWRTALLLVWSGPIYIITSTLIPKLSKGATAKALNISEEANGISEECILNVKTVAACNGQNQMIEKYASILQQGVAAAVRVAWASGFLDASAGFVYFSFNTFGLWYATISFHEGRVASAGDVFAVVYLALYGTNNFSRLGPNLLALMRARVAAAKIYETIDSARSDNDAEWMPLLDPSRTHLHVEFKNVSFSFPTRAQPVLESLSFVLEPGTSIGLVGKSGCGKSTTIKLLTRFLSTEFGQILLDGIPLEKYDKKNWRKMIGIVSQEPCLFSGSIRENICLGRSFTEQEVIDACKTAFAHEFIMALDKGYDTLIGCSGVSLSGGQKQRIAIARAIVSNPRLLLLDEATSALDTKSERIVQEALDNATHGRSSIVIAHRLSTIKNVSQVIVMESGRAVERGGYAELRTKPDGIFARMVTEQAIERRKSRTSENADEESDESSEEVKADDPDVELITEKIDEESFPTMTGGLIALLSRNKCKTFIVVCMGLLRGVATPLFALRFVFIFASLEDDDYETLLFWLMVGTMAVGVHNFVVQLLSPPICEYLAEKVMNELRVACLRSLLHRPMAYFDRQTTSPAACALLLTQQPPMALPMINNKLAIVIDGLSSCIAMLVITFGLCGPAGFIGIIYLVAYIIILILFEKFSDRAYKDVVHSDKSGEAALEIFDNVTTIQQLSVEQHFQDKYNEMLDRRDVPLAMRIRNQSVVHATNESIYYFFDFLATAIGVYFVYLGYYGPKLLFLAEHMLSAVGYKTVALSQAKREFIEMCSFNGKECDIDKDFKQHVDPEFGNCYTFNYDPKNNLTSSRAGPMYGIRVLLFVNTSDYMSTSEAAGIRLAIHPATQYPFPDTFGYSAPVGFASSFGIKKEKVVRLAGYGDCMEDAHARAARTIYEGYEYNPEASRSLGSRGCHRSCFQNRMFADCDCGDPRFPVPAGRRHCSAFNATARKCLESKIGDTGDFHHMTASAEDCVCKHACSEVVYSMTFSTSKWPSGASDLGDCEGMTDKECAEFYRLNAAMIEVYYEQLNYELLQESEAYGIVNLIADFGGHLGLWMGFSVITVVEVIALLFDIVQAFCRGRRTRKQQENFATLRVEQAPKVAN